MINIGIELNGIVRDINTQVLKYYQKDINPEFEIKNIDKNVLSIADSLDFGSKKKREEFLYIDYPYEVFGCAKTMERNLSVNLNNWYKSFENIEDKKYDIVLFSLKEEALTIQSTFYFLSKIGSRIRTMMFPRNGKEMWDKCDVIITTNENIVKNKPEGKKVVLIETNDNQHLKDYSDLVYTSLTQLMLDEKFLSKISSDTNKEHKTLISRIKHFFK